MTPSGTGWSIHPTRRIVEVNTATVDGHFLEEVPEITKGFKPGVALVNKDWNDIYLVRKHVGWGENEYFDHADRLIREKNIPVFEPKESQE